MKIRRPTAPGIVLFLLCLMYFLTYIDRVNVGTAASSIQKEFGLSNTQLGSSSRASLIPMRCSR